MAINIKNREAEALLKELKALTGKGTSKIVLELLREEAERLRREEEREKRLEDIAQIVRSAKQRASRAGTDNELVGYDEDGLPA